MLDINFIRENKEKVKKGVSAKQLDPSIVDTVLELDKKRRSLLFEVEKLRARRNEIAKEGKVSKEGKKVKEALKDKVPKLLEIEKKYKRAALEIPNLPAPDVPVGKDDSENVVLRKWGEPKKYSFQVKDHLEIGEYLDVIDVKRASKVSGPRFGYLKRDAVLLEFALIRFALDTLIKEGFVPVVPPVIVKKESMEGMGYLEHGGSEDMYMFDKDGLVFVGTCEQSIGPMHKNEIFSAGDLPLRYVGFSTCFRREAGSHGKDTRGILRVHQFDKVEMFSFARPENSDKEHEFLLSLEEGFFRALGIPYQVVKLCSGDLSAPSARTYDIEVWLPGQGRYREATSASTVTDFQARRLNIQYKDKEKKGFVHMLNGTAFAIGRTIIAILENYQQKDGSVVIPKVLRPYIGKDKITK